MWVVGIELGVSLEQDFWSRSEAEHRSGEQGVDALIPLCWQRGRRGLGSGVLMKGIPPVT